MLSAIVSRDLGFGRPLSKKELETINVARQDKRYLDEKAALEINKTLEKPTRLLSSTCTLVCTTRNIGLASIWHFMSHVSLKMWDVGDCLNDVYTQNYITFFDHSQGHATKTTGLSMQREFVSLQQGNKGTDLAGQIRGELSLIGQKYVSNKSLHPRRAVHRFATKYIQYVHHEPLLLRSSYRYYLEPLATATRATALLPFS